MNQSSSLRIVLVILCVFLVPSTSSVNLDFVKLPVDLKAFIYNILILIAKNLNLAKQNFL